MVNELATTQIAPPVLFLTDFSEASEEALRWAGHLALHHHVNLIVLYPYRLNQINGTEDLLQLRKKIETEAKNSFTKIAESVFKVGQPAYDFRAEVGFVNDRVYSYTRKSEILVVVIGKEMANTNREALNDLMDHLSTPLLIVPANTLTNQRNITSQV